MELFSRLAHAPTPARLGRPWLLTEGRPKPTVVLSCGRCEVRGANRVSHSPGPPGLSGRTPPGIFGHSRPGPVLGTLGACAAAPQLVRQPRYPQPPNVWAAGSMMSVEHCKHSVNDVDVVDFCTHA